VEIGICKQRGIGIANFLLSYLRFFLFLLLVAENTFAVQVKDLDPGVSWRLKGIQFVGHKKFSASELSDVLLTQPRPWYQFWGERPLFDPVTFEEDLERLRRFYESRGFYHAVIDHDLVLDPESGLMTAQVLINEGAPVVVEAVDVNAQGVAEFPPTLPIKSGDIFSEAAYQHTEIILKQFYGDQGYAHAESQRKAEIVLDTDQAFIDYTIIPGPLSFFGPTEIEGLEAVEPEVVRRELTYKEGEVYSTTKVIESRDRLLALDLFGTVNIVPSDVPGKPPVVPMLIRVTEKEPREIRLGIGYGTEDHFRARLEWRHNNWLGDGRRIALWAKYSSIETSGGLTFIQPHLFSPRGRGFVSLSHDRTDEETYLLQATRFNPRYDYQFSQRLSAYLGYRLEDNHFSKVDSSTIDALGGVEKKGLLSGPTLGFAWTTVDRPLAPREGEAVTFTASQSGVPWGGRYRFYRLLGEGRKYWSIGWETIFATRLKLGFADAIGAERLLPLSERLYAGGDNSVRGFGRRRLGPKSASGDPIGGLSLLEGSLELRRPVWGALGGAVFIDFGQVSLNRFDVPIDSLKFSAGVGLSYATPVGPLRVDIGIPFQAPQGDRRFQVHFSVGASF
jgi:outer membrane protein insertion porin family